MVKEVQVIKATKMSAGKKIRVAAYCRVSTRSEDQLNSFFAQMKYYTDYVRTQRDMVLVDIYADEGITGTEIAKRDEFQRLIKDCKNRKIDRVLVKSVTRFARNSLECIETVRTLKENGVSVYFENDNIDTEQMNSEMMLYIKSAFAQSEALSASKRVKTAIRMKMENGTFIPSAAPFGYRLINGELVVEPKEAETIKEIFDLYLSGAGFNTISNKLNAKEQSTKWNAYTVGYILKNERYIGDSLWNKFYTPSVLPLRMKRNFGEEEQYYCEGTHEAIISKEIFEKVQKMIDEKEHSYYKGNHLERDLFTSKIRCRHCGWIYRKKTIKSGYHWACSKKSITNDKCPSHVYSRDELDRAFIMMFNILKQNIKIVVDDTISQLQFLKQRVNNSNGEIEKIDEELLGLSRQNDMYAKLFASSVISEMIYYEKSEDIKGKITELRARRMKLVNEDENEKCIDELKRLKRIVDEHESLLSAMDEKLFTQIVQVIYAEEDGSLTFSTLGGLDLRVDVKGGFREEQIA